MSSLLLLFSDLQLPPQHEFLSCELSTHGCCPMAVLDYPLSIPATMLTPPPRSGFPGALSVLISLLEMALCPTAFLLKGPVLSRLCALNRSSSVVFCDSHSTWRLASGSCHSGRCSCSQLCTVSPPSRL